VSAGAKVYEADIIGMWEKIGCDAAGAPFVIRSAIRRMPLLFASDASDQGKVAAAFMVETCEGNRGLSDLEKGELESFEAANTTN
jgi:hypothetical protein